MKGIDVGGSEEFPEGEKVQVVRDEGVVLIVRHKGKLVALEAKCPHQGTSLSLAKIEGDQIMCRSHRAVFDLATGRLISGPSTRDLRLRSVEERDGRVLVSF